MIREKPFLSIVVAVADNGVIGREGKLPWKLGSDLKRFRKLTMGHPLVMGRRTFESIGKPLDGRDTIVVSTSDGVLPRPGLLLADTPEQAIAIAFECAKARKVDEVFVIGGAQLFTRLLPLAKRLYLTRVHGFPEGDLRWEPALGQEWSELSRKGHAAGERDEFPVTDLILERIKTS